MPSPGPSVEVAASTGSTGLGTDAARAVGAHGASDTVAPAFLTPVPTTSAPTIASPALSATTAAGQTTQATAVHHQVFNALSPLLRGGDGGYGLQLMLHPQDLGAVQVNVEVRHGEISVQLHSSNEGARDALRAGLSELRQQLEDQGLRAGSLEVGSGGANAQQREMPWSRSQRTETPTRGLSQSDQLVATAAAASSAMLDLRM